MQIIYNIRALKNISNPVVAIGVFDGFHRGHRRLIREVARRARTINGKSLILTFHPHPAKLLRKSPPLLTTTSQKLSLISSCGVDLCVVSRFSLAFAQMEPEDFVKERLVKRLGIKEIVVGEGYRFGRRRRGTIETLRRLGKVYNFKAREVKALRIGKEIVSSTKIRTLIKKGELTRASLLLGRPFSIMGRVQRGSSRGRRIGWPTANIMPFHKLFPPYGAYAVLVKVAPHFAEKHSHLRTRDSCGRPAPHSIRDCGRSADRRFKGMLNIGTRPTFQKGRLFAVPNRVRGRLTIEVHLFGFKGDLYGKELEVIFIKRLRPERRFSSIQSLKEALDIDSKKARQTLSLI